MLARGLDRNSESSRPKPTAQANAAAPARMYRYHSLRAGERLTSYDRHTTLIMGSDGNLALHNQNGVVWSTHTIGKAPGGRAYLHASGRLDILDINNNPVWTSGVQSSGGLASLRLYSTGRLEIWAGERIIWHTYTHTP